MFGQQKPLFGQPAAPAATGSVFGQPAQQQQPATTNLFGQPQQQQQPATTGLFGQQQQPAQQQAGGLFGQQQQQPAATNPFGAPPTNAQAGGGLFGASQSNNQAGGGLFGASQTQPAPSTSNLFGGSSSNLFGAKPAGPTGLFGASTTQQQPAGTTGLFGASTTQQQPASTNNLFGASTTNNLFGNSTAAAPSTGLFGASTAAAPSTGLFGASTTQQQPQQSTGLFGASTATNPLFGGASTNTNPLFGGAKPAQAQAPQGAPAFSKSTKFNDLPDNIRSTFEQIEAHIQGRVQISKELHQRKLGEEATKGRDLIRGVHTDVINVATAIHTDLTFVQDLRGKTDSAVEDTIVATRIIDAYRNPHANMSYLKDHAGFPLEFFARVTQQMRDRLAWYKSTIEQIERKLSSSAGQAQTPQSIHATLQAQNASFLALAAKTAQLDAALQRIKQIYAQLYRTRTGSHRDPFEGDAAERQDLGLGSLRM